MNPKSDQYAWDAQSILALRRYMGLSQQQMSDELGVRQQTISEWETGMYRPRGGMLTLLTMVAERVGFSPGESFNDSGARELWLRQPIAHLELKPRAVAALLQAGLQDLGQVLALWREDRRKLLEIPDFGPRSLADLEQKLREFGLIY